MGLELFSPDDDTAAVVTAVYAPDRHRRRRAASSTSRPPRRHARARPAASKGKDLPDRSYRLVRHLRHRDCARGRRAVADRARRRHRARRGGSGHLRGVRTSAPSTHESAGARADRGRGARSVAIEVRGRRRRELAARGRDRRLRRDRHPLRRRTDRGARRRAGHEPQRCAPGRVGERRSTSTRRPAKGRSVATPGANVASAAECTIRLLLALRAGNIPQARPALTAGGHGSTRSGRCRARGRCGHCARDFTAAVGGWPRRALALEMKVVTYGRWRTS